MPIQPPMDVYSLLILILPGLVTSIVGATITVLTYMKAQAAMNKAEAARVQGAAAVVAVAQVGAKLALVDVKLEKTHDLVNGLSARKDIAIAAVATAEGHKAGVEDEQARVAAGAVADTARAEGHEAGRAEVIAEHDTNGQAQAHNAERGKK